MSITLSISLSGHYDTWPLKEISLCLEDGGEEEERGFNKLSIDLANENRDMKHARKNPSRQVELWMSHPLFMERAILNPQQAHPAIWSFCINYKSEL